MKRLQINTEKLAELYEEWRGNKVCEDNGKPVFEAEELLDFTEYCLNHEANKIITKENTFISIEKELPDEYETVWLANLEKGFVWLGCLVDGWGWAESNGVIYAEHGKIVSYCETEDLDVTHWCPLPRLPKRKTKVTNQNIFPKKLK